MSRPPGDERIYRRLLRVLPEPFRSEAAPDLVDMYRRGRSRAASRGRLPLLAFQSRALADLGVTAMMERLESRRAHRASRRAAASGMELRLVLRDLRRRPGQALVGAGTLGLGIAATILLAVLVRDVLLKPLPFRDADRLIRLIEVTEEGRTYWPSFPNIRDWRERADFLDGVIAADVGAVRPVIAGNTATRARLGRVSRGFFETLGVRPVVGRDFRDDENRPGGAAVALVGEEYWRSQLGARPLDGLTLELDAMGVAGLSSGTADLVEVVGVVPAGFRFLGYGNAWLSADIWLPLERSAELGSRTTHGYHTVARMRPGRTAGETKVALDALAATLKAEHGEPTQADRIHIEPLADAVIGRARSPLQGLLVAGLAVLLVACLNLGASLLSRGLASQREFAVRSALGATRADLVRAQLLCAASLSVPGAAIGLGLAWLALEAIRRTAPDAVPRLETVTLDPVAGAAATALAIITAILAGILPALSLSLRDLADRLRGHGGTDGRGQRTLWNAFVAGQVALTLVLLATGALLLRSLGNALAVDLGYEPHGVIMADVSLPASNYADPSRRAVFFESVLERLRSDPAVTAAGITSIPPDEPSARSSRVQRTGAGEDQPQVWAGFRLVDAGFFDVLRIPVDRGGVDASRDALVVDRSLVRRLWDDRPPDGDAISTYGGVGSVAGVAGTIQTWDGSQDFAAVYMHYARRPDDLLEMHVLARGADPAAVSRALREAVAAADPLVPVDLSSLRSRVAASMGERRLAALIAIGFAATTLLLTAAGMHAMVAQVQARRMRENGIRLMLGEPPRRVGLDIAAFGLRAGAAGILVGLPLSILAGRAIRSQLFGVEPFDAIALSVPALVLLIAVALATLAPALRAARTDPLRLLRAE